MELRFLVVFAFLNFVQYTEAKDAKKATVSKQIADLAKSLEDKTNEIKQLINSNNVAINNKIDSVCRAKTVPACDEGWKEFGASCYLFSTNGLTWDAAKDACVAKGASLVKVENNDEHQFIRETIKVMGKEYFWIGARYNPSTGDHRWLDGSAMTFSAWGAGRPGNVQGCVDYLDNVGWLWNSHNGCNNTPGPYICEKRKCV